MNFLADSIKRFEYYKTLGDKTFEQLTSEQCFYQPNEQSNSIAIIVQHLYGNMLSRWTNFLTEDGEKNWRKRDAEFEPMLSSKEDVISFWNEGWKVFLDTLKTLKEDDLQKTITIRNEPLLVYDAILRQLAHYPYHVGQIVYIAKLVTTDFKSLSIPKAR
ncbi:MAG TPA: hypothetical protein DCL43_01760 [Chitinophagaceae bacterium]|nr:hypothetical protein [Chitinophagaceae bacterium]HAN38469.1 hypothetical protein [Chitinophagaceae bacterium]